MAIEFVCPECQAAIRVKDDAAGKRGKCPKCQITLLVPVVAPPPVQADSAQTTDSKFPFETSPASDRSVPEVPALFEPQPKADPQAQTGPLPIPAEPPPAAPVNPIPDAFDVGAVPVVPETTSMAARVRQRQRKRSTAWLLPALLGAGLIGITVYYFWPTQDLKGSLEAVVVSEDAIPFGQLHRSNIKADVEQLEFVLGDLEQEPQVLSSRQIPLRVELRASQQGLEFRVFEMPGGRTVEIQVKGNERFQKMLDESVTQLDKVRTRELESTTLTFFDDWYQTRKDQSGRLPASLKDYRDQIALNSMRQALGYHLEAVIGKLRYPCVYQQDDRLYFIIPKDAESFELRPRQVESGASLPDEVLFTVKVKPPAPDAEPSPDLEEPEMDETTSD